MVMSWRPSMDGAAVLTSMIIFSAIWIISGDAPTLAPGTIAPSSVMALAYITSERVSSAVRDGRPHLNDCNIQFVVLLVLGVKTIHEINREHAQVLVEELDVAIVDPLCNLLADLVRTTAFDHVQLRPSVLCLCSRRGSDEEVVFELALKAILLDMIGQGGGYLPEKGSMPFSSQREETNALTWDIPHQ